MSFGEDIGDLVAANAFGVLSAAPGWSRAPLGSVCRIINGYPFESKLFGHADGIPLVRIRDVVEGRSETKYSGPVPDGYWVHDGDLLVGMDGDFNSSYWRGGRALLNQRVCKIEPDEARLRQRFLAYVLPGYLKLINQNTSSVTVKHLSSKTLQKLPIPLPDPATQDKVVGRIDALFAEIDEGEAALTAARQGVDTYRKSLLNAAVAGELTTDWREQNKPAEAGTDLIRRITGERSTPKTRRVDRADAGDAEDEVLPQAELPSTWCWSTLGELFSVYVGATPSRADPALWNGSLPWVSSGEVAFCRISDTREHIAKKAVSGDRIHPPGTVLLGMIGEGRTRGQAAILDVAATHNQNAASIRVSETPIPPEYVYWWLEHRYDITRALGVGGNQPALNKARVQAIPLPVPPLDEALEIVRRLQTQFEGLFLVQPELDEAAISATELRQTVLAAAFSGELAA